MAPGTEEDLVLGPEAGEREDPGDRQPPDDEGHRGDRHVLPQVAHPAHVLLVVHAVDDRSGAEEQQALEERMHDHVKDGSDIGAGPDGEEHVAELADRRVREDPFDVVLRDGNGGRQQRGRARR